MLGDVLGVRILALAERADEVALGDDARARLLGIDDTTAPTLWSAMNFAASLRLRPGVNVSTSSVIASRTFTTAPSDPLAVERDLTTITLR